MTHCIQSLGNELKFLNASISLITERLPNAIALHENGQLLLRMHFEIKQ